jgi:hypothetical protein
MKALRKQQPTIKIKRIYLVKKRMMMNNLKKENFHKIHRIKITARNQKKCLKANKED